ncbi:Putative mycofactocin system creatinine amidohydrolase family protein MftE [bacterium HR36]|nr:Putative mycofactocin system creatinine amidohydrolase family protein MftE [bacterium HR36]
MDFQPLADMTHAQVRATAWEVAVLPFGATEPHNLHLPYGTDTFQVERIAREACAWAAQQDVPVLLLPALPFGVNTNYFRIPGAVALSIMPSTLGKIIADLVESLERQGIRKLLLLNGHGGNELKPILRELFPRTTVFIALCDWYRMVADVQREIFSAPGEHADEMETSLMLAIRPDLVRLEQAGPGYAKPARLEAVQRGWVSITRPWHLLTEDTGVGDPRSATAEKGQRLLAILRQRLGDFLVQLARTPLDATFPY